MKKIFVKASAFVMSAIMLTSLVGCGEKKETVENTTSGGYGDTYPIQTDKTVSWWTYIDSNITATAQNLGDTPFGKKYSENVGVDIEYQHPSTTGGSEQFNLMLSSGELPDIIDHYWTDFPGGPEKAIKDGYIIDLSDLIDKYAPNFKKFLEENPQYKKDITTDSGAIYMMPYINAVLTSGGPIIRKDWLDELGLEMPETIDEWYTVLKAFKEKKGAAAPLSIMNNGFGAFTGAYGITLGKYRDGDTIKYGYYEDSYKDLLTTLNKWYNEKLLDNNFSSTNDETVTSNFLNGVSGVTYGGITSGINKFMSAKKDDPTFKVAAAPFVAKEKGETPEFGQYTYPVTVFGSAISTMCEDPELAIRLIDYFYSEDGIMLVNYGIEGESYTMVDGAPKLKDELFNDPNGLTPGQALSQYAKPYNCYNSIQLMDAYEQQIRTPEMKNALEVWPNHNGAEHCVHNLTPTDEEQVQLAEISNALTTYCEEMFIKFVTGVEPIENFDAYKQNLEKIGVEKFIELNQAAYDRFLKR